jgi:tetratricopeptide (TPR) repeat protein
MQRTFIAILLVTAGLLGCNRKEEPAPAAAATAPEMPPSPMPELWSELSDLYMSGQTNEMLVRLEAALTDKTYADFRMDLLRELIGLQARMGRVEAAQTLFLDALADPAMPAADSMFGMIETHLLRGGNYDGLTAWLDKLEATPGLSEAIRSRLMSFRLESLRGHGDMTAYMDLLQRCVEQQPDEAAASIIAGSLYSMLNEKRYEALKQAGDTLAARFTDRVEVRRLVARLRVQALLQQDLLDESYALVLASKDVLSPQDYAQSIDALVQKGIAAGRTDLAERICDETMAQNAPDSASFRSAARQSVDLARLADNAALVQQRFSKLAAQGLPVADLAHILDTVFYFVVEKGDKTCLTALLNDADALSGRVETEADQARLATLLLDGSFLTENYDRAIRILEAGIPGKDENWHAMLLPKVKAHRAMATGNNEEAIRQFRAFMDLVATLETGFPDPLTGAMVSRESILGLNAVRIADLWDAAGKPDKAAAARKEALGYYQKALELEPADSPAAKEIQRKVRELQG